MVHDLLFCVMQVVNYVTVGFEACYCNFYHMGDIPVTEMLAHVGIID